MKNHKQKIAELNTICKKLNITVTIIGGMAVAEYGYERYTSDIDILIKSSDSADLAHFLLLNGWADLGNNKLSKGDNIINFCADSVSVGGRKFPQPESETPGAHVSSLSLLLQLKIKADRAKDRADVVELVKRNNLSRETLENLEGLNTLQKRLAIALWNTAQRELDRNF